MKLVFVFHPDKVEGEEKKKLAQEKFVKVTEAYDVLGDEDKRATYDAEIRLEDLRNKRKVKTWSAGGGGN
jgi:curved DNA-binding protein CbpA